MKWEVRTMRSGTLFFDGTIYRKTLTRFWPLWTVNLVIWLFALPFNGLMQMGDDPYGSSRSLLRFARNVGDMAAQTGLVFALLAGLIVAMAVCSYQYNNRSANFMGALPIRREGIFFSTYLAGLTMLIVPNVVVFLLTLLVEAAGGALMVMPLLFWLAALSAMEFFFYSFAVFLGQFTGHVLVLPVFYGVFNALAMGIYVLFNWVLNAYYFGYSNVSDFWIALVQCLTPVWAMSEIHIHVIQESGVWVTEIRGLWIAGAYAVAAAVLAACALLLARRRHLETAGDIVAVKIMRPVFKYGVSTCAGLFIGLIMYEMFGFSQLGLMIAVILWGLVGYFVAQMLLDKSVRVFKKWKGAAVMTAAFVLLFAVVGLDLTGYETYVPAVNEVKSVEIAGPHGYPYDSGSALNATLTDPEDIADVITLHQTIVKYGEDGEAYENEYSGWNNFVVTYTLKSGVRVRRSYNVRFGSDLNALSQTLMDKEQVRRQSYGLDCLEEYELKSATIFRDGEGREVWGEDAWELWNAVMADFEAGDIGIHVPENSQEFWSDQRDFPGKDGVSHNWEVEFGWSSRLNPDQAESDDMDLSGMKYAYYRKFVVLKRSVLTRVAAESLWQQLQTQQTTVGYSD